MKQHGIYGPVKTLHLGKDGRAQKMLFQEVVGVGVGGHGVGGAGNQIQGLAQARHML